MFIFRALTVRPWGLLTVGPADGAGRGVGPPVIAGTLGFHQKHTARVADSGDPGWSELEAEQPHRVPSRTLRPALHRPQVERHQESPLHPGQIDLAPNGHRPPRGPGWRRCRPIQAQGNAASANRRFSESVGHQAMLGT